MSNSVPPPHVDRVLQKLEQVKSIGKDKWRALCPVHGDTHPSLDISIGNNGAVLFKCWSHDCSPEDIVKAIGLTMNDLWPNTPTATATTRNKPSQKPKTSSGKTSSGKLTLVDTYYYENQSGCVIYKVERLEDDQGKKTFRPYRLNSNGGWDKGITDHVNPILYKLPEVKKAISKGALVFIVEGEKDVNTVSKIEQTATTNTFGSNAKWFDYYSECLAGAHIVILPDNDTPGYKHAQKVAESVYKTAASVRYLILPDLPEGGDISDWLPKHSQAEFEELVKKTCVRWQPGMVIGPPGEPQPVQEVNPFADNLFTLTQWFNRPIDEQWVLKPLLRRGELAFLYGAPKSGKTFLVLDMLLAVATGGNWCGSRYSVEKPLNVVLAIGEGHHGLKGRIETALIKWEATPEAINDRFRVVPLVPQLYPETPSPEYYASRFIEAIDEAGIKPDLVVIDTYARAILGADENSNKDASLILNTLQAIQEKLGCAVLVVHHANKGMGELRGASAILGGADIVLKCSRDGRSRKLEVEFAKDIPEQSPVTFDLFPVNDTDSVYVVWGEDDPTGSGSVDDRIVAFLMRENTQMHTAKDISEAIDAEQKTVIGRLWRLKQRGQVIQKLRNRNKPKSNTNPMEWGLPEPVWIPDDDEIEV